jgi:tetratricopeptide (TPR) repeat protein
MAEASTDPSSVAATCPDTDTLRAFVDERLDEASATRVIHHLSGCGRCDDAVAELGAAGVVAGLERFAPETTEISFADRLRAQRPQRRPLPKVAPVIPGLRDLDPVGRGGMGVVYRGTDTATGETVAVKVLWSVGGLTDSAHARARREVEALGRIDDPGIVRILRAGVCAGGALEPDGVPFIVMEWVDGETLQRRTGPRALVADDAARVVRDLARVLARVHGLGIVHRDIKPANVFLIRAALSSLPLSPKLVDFGLARHDDGPGWDMLCDVGGTPGYMAPEQWHGDETRGVIGPATDIYGLGATLYFLLVGRPPTDGRSPFGGTAALAVWPPKWHAADRPPIAVDLRTIVEKCLRPVPLDRYASAGELADDLGRFLGGLPIRARRAAVSERIATWVGHNQVKAVAALLTTLLVVATTTGAWLHTVRLAMANRAATQARVSAEDSLRRLTGTWVETKLSRSPTLDHEDRLFLDEVRDLYRSWPFEPDATAALRFRAEGLGKIARILSRVASPGEASAVYDEAITTLDASEQLVGDRSAFVGLRLSLLQSDYLLYYYFDGSPSSRQLPRRIRRLLDDPAARDARSPADRSRVVLAEIDLALAEAASESAIESAGTGPDQQRRGKADPEALLRELAALEARAPDDPIVADNRITGLMAASYLGTPGSGAGSTRGRLRLAAELATRCLDRFHPLEDQTRFLRQQVLAMARLCDVEHGQGDHAASVATACRLLEITREQSDYDTTLDLFFRGERIEAQIRRAKALIALGRPEACDADLVEAIASASRSVAEQPAVFTHAARLFKVLGARATSLIALGRKAEAAEHVERIGDVLRPWLSSPDRGAWARETINRAHTDAGRLLLDDGKPAEAIAHFRKLLTLVRPDRRREAADLLMAAAAAAGRHDVAREAFLEMMKDEQVRRAVWERLGIDGATSPATAAVKADSATAAAAGTAPPAP